MLNENKRQKMTLEAYIGRQNPLRMSICNVYSRALICRSIIFVSTLSSEVLVPNIAGVSLRDFTLIAVLLVATARQHPDHTHWKPLSAFQSMLNTRQALRYSI